MRRTSTNPKIVGILSLIAGVICVVIAIGSGSYQDNSVDCGSETMLPGDTCTHFVYSGSGAGTSTNYSYDQQVQYNSLQQTSGVVGGILGAIIFFAGGIFLLIPSPKSQSLQSEPKLRPTSINGRPQSASVTAQASTPPSEPKLRPTSINGRPQSASATAQASTPPSFETLIAQATQLRQPREYQEALQIYEQAQRLRPRDPRVHAGRAVTLDELGRKQEAMLAVEEAIKCAILPKDKQVFIGSHYLKALLLEKEKRYDEALAALDNVFTLDLEHIPAL